MPTRPEDIAYEAANWNKVKQLPYGETEYPYLANRFLLHFPAGTTIEDIIQHATSRTNEHGSVYLYLPDGRHTLCTFDHGSMSVWERTAYERYLKHQISDAKAELNWCGMKIYQIHLTNC